jgi:hypothetical protein
MAKHWEIHPKPLETCFGCKALGIQMNAGDAKASTSMTTKKWDGELQAYRDARAQGIQPSSTKLKDIQTAVDISNRAGRAFQADLPGKGLI